ncbi:TauD/TfdA family dioxygenase [Phenylobacterium sp.]|uniref:TauD/TfdA dioxygenase family protein n=1 Tax=Phenylobacterium sp. TaxID=1871053 RepID=UPI00262629B1|nr:TauD/TfdA family dioxygenase [Phenylobacterium sp.]
MTRPFDVEPLPATFGAVVTGLRLAALSDADFAVLYETWLDYALLIFPGQHLTTQQQVAFARRFGALEFDLAPISNVRADGSLRADDDSDDVIKVLKGNMGWHCDSTYMPVQAKGAVFTAHVVPAEGGETGFADMRAAYDALDEATRSRIADLSAYHSLHYSQAKLGHQHSEGSAYSGYGFQVKDPPLRPLVKTHPETGRKSLNVGRHAYGIPGLAPEESERLIEDLVAFAAQPPRVWHHHWSPGDAIVWDNRCLMHRACPWDMREPRVMYHSRLAGDPVAEFAAHA